MLLNLTHWAFKTKKQKFVQDFKVTNLLSGVGMVRVCELCVNCGIVVG